MLVYLSVVCSTVKVVLFLLSISAVVDAWCLTELFAPRFCKLPCGGVGVDMDTVWCEDDTVLAARLVNVVLVYSNAHTRSAAVTDFTITE